MIQKPQFNIRLLFLVALFLLGSQNMYAYKDPTSKPGNKHPQNKQIAQGCMPSSAYAELNINNVRARINAGGDLWWDLEGDAQYYIPSTPGSYKTSVFSCALWIGGLDDFGNLKLAAQRYRAGGVDFYTGPLSVDGSASIDALTCDAWDKIFVLTRAEVENFKSAYALDHSLAGYDVPSCIKEYPAHGDLSKNQSYYIAPFFDMDHDGTYDYTKGDYPYYDFDNELCPRNLSAWDPIATTMEGNGIMADQVLKGDQTLWWVFNDKGNAHNETLGNSIGLEIRAQAFAFATNDEINNMTFYSYEIINRSSSRLNQSWFGQFVDCDLGYAWDDYVGCDVLRGLGYCYNGVDPDGNGQPEAYGAQPPAIGVDFFQGPYMDPDGLDNAAYNINTPNINCNEAVNGVNFGDGRTDNERFGMQKFSYFNGVGLAAINDPNIAEEYYKFLRGIWKDDQPMTYWGEGHPAAGGIGPECSFMFPGNSDPCNWGTNGMDPGPPYPGEYWTEAQADNQPGDRRFMQSAGPFTMEPGEVNYVTVGVPWARAISGGPLASVALLRQVDDKCQILFDHCFNVIEGPDAPDLTIQELDRELILYVSNRRGISNNYNNSPEDYAKIDPYIVFPDTVPPSQRGDSTYRFEGYQIFQVKDATVSLAELKDPDKSRLTAQCDIKNGVSKIVNFYYDENLGGSVPVEEVSGADGGIVHSFRIFEDQFATEDKKLVNHKQYYFIAIAYAYNNYKTYNQSDPLTLDGQKLPYKTGSKTATGSIEVETGIPHIPSPEAGGTIMRADYGLQPMITRIEGQGNGGLALDFTQATIDQILANGWAADLEYKYNSGPVNVKVIDPLNLIGANYTLKFDPPADGDIDSCKWTLTSDNGGVWSSDMTIKAGYEQLLMDIGLSIQIEQLLFPGDAKSKNNGFISATIEYADSTKQWLSGITDIDGYPDYNWIHSGTMDDNTTPENSDFYYSVGVWVDPGEVYEKLFYGTWAPYALASYYTNGPAYNVLAYHYSKKQMMSHLASVDLVITSDQSKWSRCPVFEECENANSVMAEGGKKKLELRAGSTNGEAGMGYFPGYAINVETGERLNVAFGEDSWLQSENGRDMKWNPTANYSAGIGGALLGGKHWIYIFCHNRDSINAVYGDIDVPAYDGGAYIKQTMGITGANHEKMRSYIFKDAMWVGGPMLSDVKYAFTDPANIPCDVTIKIRVGKPYQRFYSAPKIGPASPANNNYPLYTFNTSDISVLTGNTMAAEGALDLINVVPNPYYAFSEYEVNQLDKRVRITNLPSACTINIYTVNGNLIRQFTKNDEMSFLDWDLKTDDGIPISGGIYLIYVRVEGVGEKVIKWFGALRPGGSNAF
jgi:hypothetical protein